MLYEKELNALHRSGRFRDRNIYGDFLDDLASNDYLGLANNKKQFKKAVKLVEQYKTVAPKASILVNGYHPIHKLFEEKVAKVNGFEEGIVVGSGFLANLSLIESLVRKGDKLFIDEEYHASGLMAAAMLNDEQVIKFKHNDMDDLAHKLEASDAKRNIVTVEGVYSMSGDLCNSKVFDIVDRYENSLLIVDEAHSAGTIGENLLGIFDYYNIAIKSNYIKMGTLGKAYGSYGAYILASEHIVSYLVNRAKPIIYSTAPSVFDIALAFVNFKYIRKNTKKLKKQLDEHKMVASSMLGKSCDSLIVPIDMPSNEQALYIQKGLMSQGYVVGAIRQPTVPTPIIRVILNISTPISKLKHSLALILKNVTTTI